MTADRNEVRAFERQIENIIINPSDKEELLNTLSNISSFLISASFEFPKASSAFRFSGPKKARDVFLNEFYTVFINKLLDQITVEWISKFQCRELDLCLEKLFYNGNCRAVLVVLNQCIEKYRPSYQLNRCISFLENFLNKHLLVSIFWKECLVTKGLEHDIVWDELVHLVASLPDRTANKLHKENSELFFPSSYVPLVTQDILSTLAKVHNRIKCGNDVSLEFISRLVGKLCMSGYADLLWSNLLPSLVKLVKEDFIWCRVCERIVTGVPDRCIESVLVALLRILPWYGLVDKFLGDCVLKKQKVQYLMCTKLLLFRNTQQILTVQNIIGYLSSSHTRHHLFIKTFKELVKVWSDSSAIKHSSVEQHVYITKSLFVCMGFMSGKDKQENKEELLQMLMPGVQCHIGSSDYKIRKLGMVFAEKLTALIDPKGPQLSFEYEKDEEINSLLALCSPPEDPGITDLCKTTEEIVLHDINKDEEDPKDATVDSDLDSDDDLVPYDMSHDVKVTKVKQPKYIRDCMEGLISQDDPEKVEVCLNSTESLIRKSPDGLEEIAEELSKILLHLTDKYTTANFTRKRFGSLVALAVIVPVQVSNYLTSQFYERNYNLRQRMDILEVLAAAAQELSQPKEESKQEKPKDKKIVELDSSPKTDSWRDIVQKRIESKTRRFAKGRSEPESKPAVNKFSKVAGHFFYPLMKNFDRKENTFDLLGEDALVLGRLVYTLGVIMHASVNTPGVKQMGSALLEFLWVLRFHTDQIVRHAILFACSMVFLSVPCHILMTDLQQEVLEAKSWLEEVVEKDPNTESKKLAVQCLVLLENLIKQEFNKGAEPP